MAEELSPDICVIGGGPGGIALAAAAANAAVPVVLVEKGALGGANLAYGGIPSKALTAAATTYETLRRAPAIGVTGAPLQVNLGKVHDHIRSVADAVAPNVAADRLRALGVTVVEGAARFTDRRTVVAGDTNIRARRFVVATGAVYRAPVLPGLDTVETMPVESAFDVTRKPSHLLVLGAAARGLEIAQAYNRLGVDATVIDTERALAGDDPELAGAVIERLRGEGIRIRDGAAITEIAKRRGGIRVMIADAAEGDIAVDGSHLLVIGTRSPAVDGLGLDAAGIAVDPGGIRVDGGLRTTNRRVYALGDVVAGPATASRAEFEAGRVLRAILFRLPFRRASEAIPAVTFTDPELATVGLDEAEARKRHQAVIVLRHPFIDNDLAQAERTTAGMVKVVADRRGRILGAGIVGRDAGEMIALWSLAIARGLHIDDIASFATPYPSRADASRRAAVAFHGPGLAPRWQRRVAEILRRFG